MSDRIRQSRMHMRHATLSLLERAAQAQPSDLGLAQRAVHACLDLHEEDRAVAMLRRTAETRRDDAAAWDALANLLFMRNRTAEAMPAFERMLTLDPENSIYLANYGFALRTLGADEQADAAFGRAVALDSTNPHAVRGLGQALMRAGAAAELADYCTAAMERVGPRSWLIAQYMVALARLGRRAAIAWLLDYDNVLDITQHEGFAGFDSLEAFNGSLLDELRALRPVASGCVPNDVVRDATRVRGGPWGAVAMFGAGGAPASAALIEAVVRQQARFETRLGDCLLARMRPTALFPKSAAVISHHQSYVAPHTHACTWVGILYYAAVPDTIRRGDNGKAGCMEFCPPHHKVTLGDGVWPSRLVRPQPGMMVVFPGYAYHEVHATADDGERTVITVDLHPAAGSTRSGISADHWLEGMPQE
jgi:hypothetical protein